MYPSLNLYLEINIFEACHSSLRLTLAIYSQARNLFHFLLSIQMIKAKALIIKFNIKLKALKSNDQQTLQSSS